MIYAYIGAALAVGLLIGIIALAIKWMSYRVTRNISRKTVGLISAYDELLEIKSEELQKKTEEVSEDTVTSVAVPEKKDPENDRLILNYAELMNSSTYLGADYGTVYKRIREGFSTKPEEAIMKHVRGIPEEGPAAQLLKELDYETVYRLSTLGRDRQLEVLGQSLEGSQLKLLESFCDTHKNFSVIEFYDYLKTEAEKEPHKATIYVSGRDACRRYPESVNVVVDEDICEGFRIEADNTIYEYSIKEREMV